MLSSIRNRLILLGVLIAAAVISLVPRNTTVRQLGENGRMQDVVVKRVPLKRGLDLEGGIHLALEIDQSAGVVANPSDALDRALTVIRQRVDEFGVAEPLVQKSGDDRIIVELPGERDPARAKQIVQRSAFLEFRITDMQGLFAQAVPRIDRALRRAGVSAAPGTGAASPLDQLLQSDSAGADSAQRDTAAAGDTTDLATGGPLSSLLFQGGIPGEFLVPEEAWQRVDSLLALPEVQREIPRGIEIFWGAEPRSQGNRSYRPLYAVQGRAIITGDQLADAQANIDPQRGGSIVTFELTRAGGRIFARETARHIRDHMAIILDGKVQSQPPVIQSEIGRRGQIELGNASLREAQDLALVLRAGALPAPLQIVEERTVGPSLGQDSIRRGLTAAVAGIALILVMVVGYYRFAGVLAVGGLALYALFTLGALAMFGATLTLPGLAGFILSVGMAVDANVLVFERMREELRAKRTPRAAVDMGFQNALPAIVDSNVTTVITALFLLQFGTGPVQGFAVTLIIGIIASFITAVFVNKTFFLIWLERRASDKPYQIGWPTAVFEHAAFSFLGAPSRRFLMATTAFILLGVAGLFIRGPNESVEFSGGSLIQVRAVDSTITIGRMREALSAGGHGESELTTFGGARDFLVRAEVVDTAGVDPDEAVQAAAREVEAALRESFGEDAFTIQRVEAVGPRAGHDLRTRALLAVLLSFGATLVYITFRFEWRFAIAAVGATAWDILLTVAFIGLLRLEISLLMIAAILTIVGYSLNDKIVVFDRVRENLHKYRRDNFVGILNRSLNETLPRTVLTGGSVIAALVTLLLFAGPVIRDFSAVMTFGIVLGTFSSIYVGPLILLAIERRWPGEDVRGAKVLAAPAPEAVPTV